ncbi:MAG: methylmalonyl Co-A mutase-associated GTPase MeaB [Flavobacteriales bacterium]|nr:methylmalonyl Co-A mutase-associated GTPase MeaB [Flavobacteriales bacterium]
MADSAAGKSLNPKFTPKLKTEQAVEDLARKIIAGDRQALAQAITLIESVLVDDRLKQETLMAKLLPHAGRSTRIGITGIPGAGKSTLIEAIGMEAVSHGRKVAVLAVDPSSQISGGSILGDKTRMEKLSRHASAFIRPSPSSGNIGGVAQTTRESIVLCEAAGYDTIFIETVGVGQSETAVHSMVDIFVLVTIPGTGDELQGIKRGIMEMADLILINKASQQADKAKLTNAQIGNILHLFPPHPSGMPVQVLICDAFEKDQVADTFKLITAYEASIQASGYKQRRRMAQQVYWFRETLQEALQIRFLQQDSMINKIKQAESEIMAGKADPYHAAMQIIDQLFK